jgi:hypothetical protein
MIASDFATAAEILAYLRSSHLPSLLCEGADDVRHLTLLERYVSSLNVLPVGGKEALLFLLERSSEFSCQNLFLMDRDDWVINPVPANVEQCQNVVLTEGYSIENDLLASLDIDKLLRIDEVITKDKAINCLGPLMAASVPQSRKSRFDFQTKLSRVIDVFPELLSKPALIYLENNQPNGDCVTKFKANHLVLYRGKTLLQIYSKILGERGRYQIVDVRAVLQTVWQTENTPAARLRDRLRELSIPQA